MVLGVLAALVLAVLGGLALVATRHVAVPPDPRLRGELSAPGRLAVLVRDGLDRTASAVDTLVDQRPDEEVLRRPVPDPDARRTTLAVVGIGFLGLAAVLLLGIVLLAAG